MRYLLSTLAVLAGLLAAVAGCRPQDQIEHYRAPKDPAALARPQSAAAGAMLGAIVPHGSDAWFFKLTGPVVPVASAGNAFRKFIASVHFDGSELRYNAPADWQAQGASGMRRETLLIPAAGKPLELAISTFPILADDGDAYVLSNINRWRGQMGLADIAADELAANTNKVALADGTTAILVAIGAPEASAGTGATPAGTGATPAGGGERADDRMLAALVPQGKQAWFFKLTGPAAAVAGQREAFRKFVESVTFEGDAVHYVPPDSWQSEPGAGMRYETFRIPAAGKMLELGVTTLVKPPGNDREYLLANVNRWREQLGLAPLGPKQLSGETVEVPLAGGQTATLVDLAGKLQAGGAPPFAPGK